MRKGRLYSIFDVSPRPGLSNYLSGMDANGNEELDLSEYIQQTEVENLLIMTSRKYTTKSVRAFSISRNENNY